MNSGKDFIYENAPVAEIIAEVLWELNPILGSDLAYDPMFDFFSDAFIEKAKESGFSLVENIIPNNVPREMLAHRAILRIRKNKNCWPLYQIGPGILTANITPPYAGWSDFFPVIQQGLELLFTTYPQKQFKPKALKLIYINAFEEKHGYENPIQFLTDGLEFDIGLPEALKNQITEDSFQFVSDFSFSVEAPENTSINLRVGIGKNNEKDAIIVENKIIQNIKDLQIGKENIVSWYDEAHKINRTVFESYISASTRNSLGEKVLK